MKTPRSILLPILRSETQAEILALVLLHPDEEYTLREIGEHVGASGPVVHREVSLLVEAGVFTDRRVGRTRVVRANPSSPSVKPLTELVAMSYGVIPELAIAFSAIDGIERAFVYGSWAARHHGEPGPEPRDIDVLIIGSANRLALFEAAASAEKNLRREVNVHQVSPAAWRTSDDSFLTTVRSRPLADIDLPTELP